MKKQYIVLKDGMALKNGGTSVLDTIYTRDEFDCSDRTFGSRLDTGWMKLFVATYKGVEIEGEIPAGMVQCECGKLVKIPPPPTPTDESDNDELTVQTEQQNAESHRGREETEQEQTEAQNETEEKEEQSDEEEVDGSKEGSITEASTEPLRDTPAGLRRDGKDMVQWWEALPRLVDDDGKERRNVRGCYNCATNEKLGEHRSKSEAFECYGPGLNI